MKTERLSIKHEDILNKFLSAKPRRLFNGGKSCYFVFVFLKKVDFKIEYLLKELSFCHIIRFSNSYNLATHFPRPLIFQTINSGRSNSLNLKYQKFTPSVCKDIWVRKFKFVAKTQFLYIKNNPYDLNKKP